jgi:hypothetical protein
MSIPADDVIKESFEDFTVVATKSEHRDRMLACLLHSLAKHTHLEKLALVKSVLDDKEALELWRVLVKMEHFHELRLQHNSLGTSLTVSSFAAKVGQHIGLKHLDLSHNELSDEGTIALVKGMSTKHLLTYLDLSFNRIGAAGGKAIGAMLSASTNLEVLLLHKNDLYEEGVAAIMNGLVQSVQSKLRVLDLSATHLNGTQFPQYSPELKHVLELSHLMLQDNAVGTDGGRIIELLSSPLFANLKNVNLSNSMLGANVCTLLTSPHNVLLRELHIDKVCLLDAGGAQVLSAANVHQRLRKLSMKNNGLSRKTAAELALLLQSNTRLFALVFLSHYVLISVVHLKNDLLIYVLGFKWESNDCRDCCVVSDQ